MNERRTLRICLAALTLLLIAQQALASQTYKIRKGDTLSTISRKFSTTVAALAKANNINPAKPIRSGRILVIPSSTPTYSCGTRACAAKDGIEVGFDGKVIATLPEGSEFVIQAKDEGSLLVKLADSRSGWVPADAVRVQEVKSPAPVTDPWSVKRGVVRAAYAYRGTRYRWGGMSSRGFDCSGFVKHVYASRGLKLPHSSRSLYRCGTPVAKSEIKEGDLVFFARTYRRGISHVGLYIGNGKFIHASTRRGGVRVDDLDADYYRRRYVGARRL